MPKPEDYRMLVEREWADLHHSRIQEWSALGVVAGTHIGLVQLVNLAADANVTANIPIIAVLAGFLAAIFSVLGALMTCRHRHLMTVKLGWIYQAEHHLGLVKTGANPTGVIPENAKMMASIEWRSLALPRLLSSSGIILSFYVVLFVIDVVVVFFSVSL